MFIFALPLLIDAFEAACVASEAITAAGIGESFDATATYTIRLALRKIGPSMGRETLTLGAAGSAATGAGFGAMIEGRRVTQKGVEYVMSKLAKIMEHDPTLVEKFRTIRSNGAHFYPTVDDGLCLACSFTYKKIPRRFSMRIQNATDPNQFRLFLQTCVNGMNGKFYNPNVAWFRYHGWD